MRQTLLVLTLALTLATALPTAGTERGPRGGSWFDAAQGVVRGTWERIVWLLEETGVLPRDSGPYADPSGKPGTSD